jgi:hypothetical protein
MWCSETMSRVELGLGALTEATITKFVYDDLREEIALSSEKIVSIKRSALVNNVEIDLLVETDKSVYVVEVKVKPRQRDVDELVKKAEEVQKVFRKLVKLVLAGARVGREVVAYARSRNANVYTY